MAMQASTHHGGLMGRAVSCSDRGVVMVDTNVGQAVQLKN